MKNEIDEYLDNKEYIIKIELNSFIIYIVNKKCTFVPNAKICIMSVLVLIIQIN